MDTHSIRGAMFFTSEACEDELVNELSELICELDDFNDEGGVTALLLTLRIIHVKRRHSSDMNNK